MRFRKLGVGYGVTFARCIVCDRIILFFVKIRPDYWGSRQWFAAKRTANAFLVADKTWLSSVVLAT